MQTARQQLIIGIPGDDLNGYLERGARVVWIHRDKHDRFDVVLETAVELEVTPELIVLDFLANVPESLLEEKMLEGADLGTGVARSALNALAGMVKVPGG